jgi:hypothetical protein
VLKKLKRKYFGFKNTVLRGQGGEMSPTMYAHMNKEKKYCFVLT